MYINILTDGSYLIQKKFFCLHCDKNSNVKKNRKLFKINIKNNHNVDSLTQANNL